MASLEQSSENTILKKFVETRQKTLELVKTLEKDDFVIQTAYYMSPPKWHLGHVSWLFEIVLNKIQKNYEFYSKEFSDYLNSYYNQFGKPFDKGKRGLMSRPTTDEILNYYDIITKKITNLLQKSKLDEQSLYLYTMAINHECQHQELLVYDLQNLLGDCYRPIRKNIKPDVSTLCIGQAASMGSFLLAAGKKGKRFSLPNSRIMVHQPSAGFQGQATDIEIHANEVLSLKKRLNEIYSKHTGKPVDEIKIALERDNFMTPENAKDFGLIDKVVEKRE